MVEPWPHADSSISEPGVAAAATHALVDAPASRWARILPWDRASFWRPRVSEATGSGRRRRLAVDTPVAAPDIAKGWLWVAVGCLRLARAGRGGRSGP